MIFTREYLNRIATERNIRFSSISQQRILNENAKLYRSISKYDLFLSHSSLDKPLVYSVVDLFNKSGYSAYVDWMVDAQLERSAVNKKTSEVLRFRMDTCKGLAYIATANSTDSKWCPWELGYTDGKTKSRCVILPILDSALTAFKGQEYLGLYPYIEYAQKENSTEYDFWVNDNEDTSKYIILSSWLKGHDPIKH